ncbi:MAG: hypothetical protein CM15mP120_29290 [Pseudomonadota bacterium]|nr:MAG: hypothetical protein CM15mP120_29290 [Pseudomonadota bacterium]
MKGAIKNRQPYTKAADAYSDALKGGGKEHVLIDALVYAVLYLAFLVGMAWSGYALEAALCGGCRVTLALFILNTI